MHTMIRTTRRNETTSTSHAAVRRTRFLLQAAAVFMVATVSAAGLQAQQQAANSPSYSYLDLNSPVAADAASSSSVSTSPEPISLFTSDSTQPPPRRTYSRPRYSDNTHNPDGSNKYTFVAGVGLTLPISDTNNYYKPSYSFQFGGGRNFNKNFAVLAQFDWDNFGIQTATLNKLLAIYQNLGATDASGNSLSQLGGTAHAWSFSVNPMYTFKQSEKTGIYIVGGAGFYHKTTNFTTPSVGEECTFYGCFEVAANASIDKYTSNAPGFNGGLGLTYRPSRFAGERFFAEARYVYVLNEARAFQSCSAAGTTSCPYFDVFPQNADRTSYIPIKFGLRF